ncbi:MAG: hypothetical protein LBT59_02450, partial [Clostridiales bacterium]|nr:hypothetical protein [Clostridiales bacterium]
RITKPGDPPIWQYNKIKYQEGFLSKEFHEPVLAAAIAYDKETKTYTSDIIKLAFLSHGRQIKRRCWRKNCTPIDL